MNTPSASNFRAYIALALLIALLIACSSASATVTLEPTTTSEPTPTPSPANTSQPTVTGESGIRFVPVSELYPDAPEWVTGPVESLAIDADGTIWASSTSPGLYRSRDGGQTWQTLTQANGLPSDSINALATSRDSVLWVGAGGGLAKTSDGGETWQTITTLPDRTETAIRDIAIGADGTVWVRTDGGYTFSLNDGDSWQLATHPGDVPRPFYGDYLLFTVGADGTAYIGTLGDILVQIMFLDYECARETIALCEPGRIGAYSPQGNQWSWLPEEPSCEDFPAGIYGLAATSDGTLWSADPGLEAWIRSSDGTSWHSLRAPKSAFKIGFASDGGIWAGYDETVTYVRREENRVLVGQTIAGLPSCGKINVIAEAPDGNIWVAKSAEWEGPQEGLYRTTAPVSELP